MTPRAPLAKHLLQVSQRFSPRILLPICMTAALLSAFFVAVPTRAQTPQQQYVYASVPTSSTTRSTRSSAKTSRAMAVTVSK